MSIVSLRFAVFVAVMVAAYHVVRPQAQRYVLLLGSYAFYWMLAGAYVGVLLGMTAVTFVLAVSLQGAGRLGAGGLWLGVVLNFGALAVLRHEHPTNPFAGPFLVAGLSFYSLQAVSYLADLHSGKVRQRADLADLALYLAYFPKLVAGPIEQSHTFLARIARRRPVDDAVFASAVTLIAVGITRKLVIADPLATLLPKDVFTTPLQFSSTVAVASLIGYAFVLYNDFTGYTAIVRGVSRLVGIELSPNFAQPFFASSFTDFWNRWHISLSHWLRDYVYLPLSRILLRRNPSLRNVPNVIVPPMAAMLISGLWHAPTLGMLIWGSLHGLYLVCERAWSVLHPARGRPRPAWVGAVGVVFVFMLGTAALSFFRMNASVALQFWQRVLSGSHTMWPPPSMLLFVAMSLGLDWITQRHGEDAVFHRWPRIARAALLALAFLLWFLMTRGSTPPPFVYQGF
jgi:alginate O-acetyltransferase complex protein AlgI